MGGDWKELVSAAEKGDLDIVRYHIMNGIDPNYQHPEFLTTPLIECAQAGQTEIVKFLLENGAKPNIRGIFDKMTALEVARVYKHKAIIKILEKYQ
jgi:ankyrin repeat protein